jgi:hypothetical protein
MSEHRARRNLVRAAIAGFALAVLALAALAVTAGRDDTPSSPGRLPRFELPGLGESTSAALYPAVPVEYRLRGSLPDLPAAARVWKLGRDLDAERVQALARALAVDGAVQEKPDEWTVGATGRVLRVERLPGLPWYFSPYAEDVVACSVPPARPGAEPAPDAPASSDGCAAPLTRPAGLPTREQAEATARQALDRAGIDVEGWEVRVDDGVSQWQVAFEPVVGGLPTAGFTTRVAVGPKGVVDASGWLAVPEAAEEYPLASARAGFDRLKSSPGVGPQPLTAQAEAASPAIACDPAGSCPTPAPVVRTVTGVRLGLAFASLVATTNEEALLVPVFLFDVEDGNEVPVIAVADELLPEPAPSPSPKPGVTEPGATEPGATEPGGTGGGNRPGATGATEPAVAP